MGKERYGMGNKIPNEVPKQIFPRKSHKSLASERVYSKIKQMILSGKFKRGQRLL